MNKDNLSKKYNVNRRNRENVRRSEGLCTRCGKEPAAEGLEMGLLCIAGRKAYKDGLRNKKVCTNCRFTLGSPEHAEKCLSKGKLRFEGNKKAGMCSACGKFTPVEGKYRCERCLNYGTWKSLKLKREAIQGYGGKCICCGESSIVFLCLDHIDNNGKEHRKQIGGGGGITYRWVIKNNFPPGIQILCWNCNSAKQIYGGCTHQIPEKELLLFELEGDKTYVRRGARQFKFESPKVLEDFTSTTMPC